MDSMIVSEFILGLVEQLRRILGLSLDDAIKLNPLQNDDLAVPRFLLDCINIIDQGRDYQFYFLLFNFCSC